MTDKKIQMQRMQSNPSYNEDDLITVPDIFLILARHIKIILITPTIICILTIYHVKFIAQPVYVSSSKIMSSSSGDKSQMAGLASQFGIQLPTGRSEPNWVYEDIIKSRTLAKVVLMRKFTTLKFGPQKSLLQILTYGNDEPNYGLDTLETLGVNSLLGMIDVDKNPKTGIYTLTVSGFEPLFVMQLNKSIIKELDLHQREYSKSINSETRRFIEERIFETKKELEMVEEKLRDFTIRNRRIENSPLLLLEQQRLSRETSVYTSVFTSLKEQLERTKIEEVRESEYIIVLDQPEVPLKRLKPKKKRTVILAGLFGISLGIIIGFILEFVKNSRDEEKNKLYEARSLFLKNLCGLIPGKSKKIELKK